MVVNLSLFLCSLAEKLMFLNGCLLHLLVGIFAHIVDKACEIVFLADTAELFVELIHDDMHTYIVLWVRTGLVVASIVEVIRTRVSAVSGRN